MTTRSYSTRTATSSATFVTEPATLAHVPDDYRPPGSEPPLEAIGAEDQWLDPIEQAKAVTAELVELTAGAWRQEGLRSLHHLRAKRADSPLVLAVTEAALTADPREARQNLAAFSEMLGATDWARDIALGLRPYGRLAITSLGEATLMVLDECVRIGVPAESIVVSRSYLGRGIGYLRVPVVSGPPTEADALLAAGVAGDGTTMWTTTEIATDMVRVRLGSGAVVPIIHPLAELSPLNRDAYRPADYLVQADR